MKVSELIAALQGHDPDMLVVVDGFDQWGFDEVKELEPSHLVPVERESAYGPYFEDPARPGIAPTGEPFVALYLHAGCERL